MKLSKNASRRIKVERESVMGNSPSTIVADPSCKTVVPRAEMNHFVPTSILLLLMILVTAFGCNHQPQWLQADFIFANGTVVTVDDIFSRAQALAVKDGKIVAVGADSNVLSLRGPDTRVIDIRGKTIIPGLQDSHIHFIGLGSHLKYEVDLTFALSAEEVVQMLKEHKERLDPAPGEWIRGDHWDQGKYPEMFTRWQLDEVTPDNPVRLSRVYRGVAVNTAALRLMGIDDEEPSTWPVWWLKDPPDFSFGDKILRSPRRLTIEGKTQEYNVPTGVFLGRATGLLGMEPRRHESLEDRVQSVAWGAEEMLSLGVTSIVDPSSGMGQGMVVYQEAYNRGLLKGLRVSAVYEGIFHQDPPEEISEHLDEIKINNLGNHFLRWRGTKFYADGGSGSRTSWLSEPFNNWEEIEGRENYGLPVVRDSAKREAQFRAAVAHGWDLHTHTTGDMAMRQTVDLYMKLMDEIHARDPDADLRWSLIHAYFPIEPKTRVLEDMAKYGIIASCDPVFQWQEGKMFAANLGENRMTRMAPFRSYMKAGIRLNSGSDFGPDYHDPWVGLYALLTRRDQATGIVYGPDETLGIEDALRTYTINGAYLTYEEDFKGSLEVGKIADLAVLDLPDIKTLEDDPELCFEMRDKVLLTMTDGKVRYQKEGFEF
jgi:predicted amidohydrolase YtcJ